MSLYRLENIEQRYGGKTVLSIPDWSVAEGTITGLCGPNGSGKSTLLRLLGFTDSPARGRIFFRDRATDIYAGNLRKKATLLPQESYLLKRTVYRNIAYGLRIRGEKKNQRQRVAQALSLVGLDAESFAERPWYALSGGEARRAAMAARLVLNPEVLLLDEPTAGVDAQSAQMMKQAAADAHFKNGVTLVIASHDLQWLEDICTDIFYMFDGKLLGKGTRTFIFGPWEKTGDNGALCRLADGQVFLAENAPKDPAGAAAAIEPEELSLHLEKQDIPPEKTAVKGILVRLALEKHSGRLRASISAGHTEFIVYPDPKSIHRKGFLPGSPVWLAYTPQKVKWFGKERRP
ncbi:MAG: energy-coupling factor ABC transporter ATP-binding protein [Desulfobacteraceae bacterium]|nr:energy-coupling factor ABC transporter ATP-binding protein [Desulfobacteraceae bacterium]